MIKCPPDLELNPVSGKCCPTIQYWEPGEAFIEFWKANLKGDYSCYDFDKAFKQLQQPFEQKLNEHGLTNYDDFEQFMDEIGVPKDQLTYSTDYCPAFIDRLVIEDIEVDKTDDLFARIVYEATRKCFGETEEFQQIGETLKEMQNPPVGHDREAQVILMDKVIDTVHITGSLWDNLIDIEELREDFEEEWRKKNAPHG